MDTHKRSIAKSVTWRLVGVFILAAITWEFTKSVEETTKVTVVFHGIRLVLYYWHERIWERVSWGRIKHPLARYEVRPDLTPGDHEQIRRFLEDRAYAARTPEYHI